MASKTREKCNEEIANKVEEQESVQAGVKKETRGCKNTRTGKSYTS